VESFYLHRARSQNLDFTRNGTQSEFMPGTYILAVRSNRYHNQPASTASKAPASTTASKAPAKSEGAKAAKKTASKSAKPSTGEDGEKKKKRNKTRKETYSSYIYKGK
jgi:hypothetical protein